MIVKTENEDIFKMKSHICKELIDGEFMNDDEKKSRNNKHIISSCIMEQTSMSRTDDMTISSICSADQSGALIGNTYINRNYPITGSERKENSGRRNVSRKSGPGNSEESLSASNVDGNNLVCQEEHMKINSENNPTKLTDSRLNDFLPFISEGTVALPDEVGSVERYIHVLRDTGSSVSLLLSGVLPLSDRTFTGNHVLLQGVEMGSIKIPLH